MLRGGIKNLVYPLVAANCGPSGEIELLRYVGNSFFFTCSEETSWLATCGHVVGSLGATKSASAEVVCAHSLVTDRVFPVLEVRVHERDFALLRVPIRATITPVFYPHPIQPSLDVASTGFYARSSDSLKIEARLLKGYVTRVAQNNREPHLPSGDWVFETSFASIEGFSGGPVYTTQKATIAGMLFCNVASKVVASEVLEYKDEKEDFRETVYRLIEFGLAHRPVDLVRWAHDLGVTHPQRDQLLANADGRR